MMPSALNVPADLSRALAIGDGARGTALIDETALTALGGERRAGLMDTMRAQGFRIVLLGDLLDCLDAQDALKGLMAEGETVLLVGDAHIAERLPHIAADCHLPDAVVGTGLHRDHTLERLRMTKDDDFTGFGARRRLLLGEPMPSLAARIAARLAERAAEACEERPAHGHWHLLDGEERRKRRPRRH